MTEVTIILNEEEAKKFILFQKHYNNFSLMVEKGVFDVKNGSISLHFDNMGVLQIIQRADVLYSKRFNN